MAAKKQQQAPPPQEEEGFVWVKIPIGPKRDLTIVHTSQGVNCQAFTVRQGETFDRSHDAARAMDLRYHSRQATTGRGLVIDKGPHFVQYVLDRIADAFDEYDAANPDAYPTPRPFAEVQAELEAEEAAAKEVANGEAIR